MELIVFRSNLRLKFVPYRETDNGKRDSGTKGNKMSLDQIVYKWRGINKGQRDRVTHKDIHNLTHIQRIHCSLRTHHIRYNKGNHDGDDDCGCDYDCDCANANAVSFAWSVASVFWLSSHLEQFEAVLEAELIVILQVSARFWQHSEKDFPGRLFQWLTGLNVYSLV